MRRIIVAIGLVAAGLIPATAAASEITLEFGDEYFVGTIVNGIPSSSADELAYINTLITVAAGDSATIDGDGDPDTVKDIRTYDRSDSSLSSLPSIDPLLSGGESVDIPDGGEPAPVDVTGVIYILAKYGGGHQGSSLVWLVSGLADGDTVILPRTFDGKAISHYTLFVPDGGATLMLLGGALVALGALRRRFGV